jgi:DNA-binding beta-propeller fold protein YncE
VPAQDATVYDCRAESVITAIPLQDYIQAMVWSAAANKLYVSFGRNHEYIQVIDCRTDSFLYFINPVGHSAYSLCPDDAAGKLYYGRDSAIGVIDVNSDSVVSRVYLPGGPDWLLLNPVSQRLYVQDGSRGIYVLDCYTDSIVDSFPYRFGSPGGIDPARNRMYLFMDTILCAVDLSTGLIVDTLTTASVNSMTLDVLDNKVYAFRADDFNLTDSVLVIDADSGRTLRVLRGPDLALRGVVWNPLMNRIYVGGDNWVGAVASKQAPVGMRGPRLPTIVRGLPAGAVVFDAMGRKVVGAKAGVYFVGEGSGIRGLGSGKMRKVVIQK